LAAAGGAVNAEAAYPIAWREVDSLFRGFAVEVFVVCLRIGTRMVYDTIPMIRRRIERIELQWDTATIDDVVIHPSRD
jgi:hypothetical protein